MKQQKNKKYWWIILLLLMSTGIWYMLDGNKPLTAQEVTTTESYKVQRGGISTSILATGIIKPKIGAEVKVGSRVSGIVKKLHVNIGDTIQKGALIAELDDVEYFALYNQALAAVENERSNRDYVKMMLTRQKRLRQKNFNSQNDLDVAQNNYNRSVAQVKQMEANLDYAQIQLGYTKIYATISGVIASISTQEGETIAASFSAPTFATILNLDRLEIWAYVDETDIGKIQSKQKATFTVDTYSNTDFEGTVQTIYPKAVLKDNVVNYIAIISLDNHHDKILRPEMTTTVRIHSEKKEDVLIIPSKAIIKEFGKKHIKIRKGKTVEKREIKTGIKQNKMVEIIHGINENEIIIIDN
ncbi:MAG: efflux RND transporter periplasmic adaptor subunit [Flavobacteriales bacterium]|nr:efflux RND transporter periplasmic adaptor subunit [Flavobacteriales bacterium]